ncbi:CotS family spore coat protein [Vallitalea guaymasensis]|uniref:CotS family spore coat protein n=1 Tax=Vallitalea guaymasensis TaxID=1185412 RepID=UPI0023551FF3|nr:CotS family spore coat protein [Vallitalea guaymasensis]
MPSEDLSKVLDNYNIEVLNIKNENYKVKKGVWWIQTPTGYKILKKNSIPKERLNFIIAAIEYLSSRGINMPKIIESKKGEKFIEADGANYLLNEAIPGKAPSSKTTEGLEKIIKELARFHAASVGFQPPSDCKPNILLGTWYDKSSKKMNKLNEYYEQEKNKSTHSEFGNMILKEFPNFRQKMETALNKDSMSLYNRWVAEIQKTTCLVHQDFIDGNLIMTDKGKIYVLDPDSLAIEVPTKDIRKFLNKIMKKRGSWDMKLTIDILKWYQEVNPLEPWQWQVLKSTVMYPHLFAGLMSKYYQKREASWSESKYLSKLKNIIDIENSKEYIIDNFEQIIASL